MSNFLDSLSAFLAGPEAHETAFRYDGPKEISARHRYEQQLIARCFNGIAIATDISHKVTQIAGSIETSPRVARDYVIDVPPRYPYWGPQAFAVDWIPTGPHVYADGELCLWKRDQWSSAYTLAYAVAKTIVWIQKHEVFRTTGQWPGRQQSH